MGYTKLFASIVASTIWREDDKTRLVWITMLAMKNERHMVEASIPGLADLARVTLPECEMALAKLQSSDKYSRNQDHGGKRIEVVNGGWLILNGEFYRRQMSLEDRREYQKLYQRKYRAKKKAFIGPTYQAPPEEGENHTNENKLRIRSNDQNAVR